MNKTISKDDPRIIRTRKAFINAFFELLEEKDYDSIKISDIVESSGYSKQAFYLHFASKEDLVERIIDEQYTVLESLISDYISSHPQIAESRKEIYELHRIIFGFATIDKRKSVAMHSYPCFHGFSLRFINRMMTLQIPIPLFNYRQKKHIDYFNSMAAYFLNVSIGYWIERDFSPDIDEKVSTFMNAAFGSGTSFPIPEEPSPLFVVHENISIKKTKNTKITAISKNPLSGNSIDNLMSALIELSLANKPLSVLSISKKAGYSRTTFYKSFESVPDLIDKTMENEISELCAIILKSLERAKENNSKMKTIWLPAFRHISTRKDKYYAFFTRNVFSSFTSRLLTEIMKIDLPIVELNKVKMEKDEQGMIATAYLLFGSIQYFVTNRSDYDAEQMAALFAKSFYKN